MITYFMPDLEPRYIPRTIDTESIELLPKLREKAKHNPEKWKFLKQCIEVFAKDNDPKEETLHLNELLSNKYQAKKETSRKIQETLNDFVALLHTTYHSSDTEFPPDMIRLLILFFDHTEN